jgi:hypothetical protein
MYLTHRHLRVEGLIVLPIFSLDNALPSSTCHNVGRKMRIDGNVDK